MLQETDIVDENIIKMYWKMKQISSCVDTNRGGVIPLFDNSYELLESHVDGEHRMAAIVIENDRLKTIVVNVHSPNGHRTSYTFIEQIYDKIFEVMVKHPDSFVILGGDFNVCLSECDQSKIGNIHSERAHRQKKKISSEKLNH